MASSRAGPILAVAVAVGAIVAGIVAWALLPAGGGDVADETSRAPEAESAAARAREPDDRRAPPRTVPRARVQAPAPPEPAPPADWLVLPAQVAALLPKDDTVAAARVEAFVAIEDESAPSGVAIVGPVAVERTKEGVARVALSGRRALRWWVPSARAWLSRDAAARDATPAISHSGDFVFVRVIDARGRAVPAVDVALWITQGSARTQVSPVATDALGVALVPIPSREGPRAAHAPGAESYAVKVALPFVPPVAAPVPAEGRGPVVLQLPESGAVEVVARPPDGSLPTGRVFLHPDAAGTQETGFADYASALLDDDGVARFPTVGLGIRFTARLAPGSGLDRVTTGVEFAGPAKAGASARVEIPYGALRPAFAGRLVRPDGAPAVGLQVQVAVARQSPATPWLQSTTGSAIADTAGRFRATLDLDASEIRGADVTLMHGLRELLRRPCPNVDPGGTADLGDVVVDAAPDGSALPLLVAGTVRDEEGRPAPEVLVQAWRRRGEHAVPVLDARATTDSAGAFEIRTAPTEADAWDVRIAYDAASRAARPAAFSPGERDVVLIARRTGTVDVRVLLPPGLPPAAGVDIVLDGDAAQCEEAKDGVVRGMVLGSGHRFSGLAAGSGRIVARARSDPTVVLRTLDVTSVPGKTVDAGTLDLRGAIPVVSVRVLGDDGKPALDGAVWWRPSRGSVTVPWNSVSCGSDGAAVLPAFVPIDVLGFRAGRGFAEALNVASNVTLAPPPAGTPAEVEVVLGDGVEVPSAPFRLHASLLFVGDSGLAPGIVALTDPRSAAGRSRPFDTAQRRVRFQIAAPGRYAVSLQLSLEHAGGSRGQILALDPPATVTIGDDRAPRRVVVDVPAERLAEVRRRLESQ